MKHTLKILAQAQANPWCFSNHTYSDKNSRPCESPPGTPAGTLRPTHAPLSCTMTPAAHHSSGLGRERWFLVHHGAGSEYTPRVLVTEGVSYTLFLGSCDIQTLRHFVQELLRGMTRSPGMMTRSQRPPWPAVRDGVYHCPCKDILVLCQQPPHGC